MEKRWIVKTAIFSVCFILINVCNGQNPSIPQVIPPTPNVASIAKYGDIPMGLYTGQANFTIPLYEVKYNDFSFPISLSYNSSGFKLEEYPGWVGMGWSLQATGVITRQTRGIPDERLNGYNGSAKRGLEIVRFIEEGALVIEGNRNLLNQVSNNTIDSEPDMFVFSVPGGPSGKFFFDETQCNTTETEGTTHIKHAIVSPYQKIDVRGYFDYSAKYTTETGKITKFEITDQRGVVYRFSVIEQTAAAPEDIDNGSATLDFGNAWYLSNITTPNGNSINFSYKYRVLDNPPTVFERMVIPDDFNVQPTYSYSSTVEAILEQITFRNGAINFTESTDSRLDWNSSTWPNHKAVVQPKSLAKISITTASTVIKEFEFTYGYFGFNARLRLDRFQEKNGNESRPAHKFEYVDGTFPNIGNTQALLDQDHWGYFTAGNNNTLLTPFFGVISGDLGEQLIALQGNQRIPNHQMAKAGLLNKIIYPTGGYTTFEYEPHDFYSESQPTFVPPQGDFTEVGKASVTTGLRLDEKEQRTTFTLPLKTYGKVEISLNPANCGEGVATVRLLRKNTQEQIFSYSIYQNANGDRTVSSIGPEPNTVFSLLADTYEIVSNASIESTCSVPIQVPAKASISYLAFVKEELGSNYNAGGFRVKSVSDCLVGANGASCLKRSYAYRDPVYTGRSSGVLINAPTYFYPVTLMQREGGIIYDIPGGVITSGSQVPIASSQGSTIGYEYVSETRDEGGTLGKSLYKFTTAKEYPDEVVYQYPFPSGMDNDWKRGSQIFKKDFDATAIVKQESYQQTQLREKYRRKIGLKTGPTVIVTNISYTLTYVDYKYTPYFFQSGLSRPEQNTNTIYEGNVGLTTVTNNFYDNTTHLQLVKSETSDSEGNTLKTTYKYVEDVAGVVGLTPSEITGIQSNPNKLAVIETEQFKNTVLLRKNRNLYTGVRLSKSLSAIGSNPLVTEFTINQYDSYGNITYYTTKQGDNVSFIYDQKKVYPIAMVKNTPPSNIFYTSFEDEVIGFIDGGKTGLKCKNGYANTLTGLSVGNYILSYWTNVSGAWVNTTTPVVVSGSSYTINLTGLVDEIRFYPADAEMTTYTYKIGYGISSITDQNNVTTKYDYYNLGNLKQIIDSGDLVLKRFYYNYKN